MSDSKSEYPLTRASLLVQLKDEDDQEAWQQFVSIYRPIIYRMAYKRGLQDADAQDLVQQVLFSVSQSIGRWEKLNDTVRFRHWLRRIAKNAFLNAVTRGPKDLAIGGSKIANAFKDVTEDEEQLSKEIELEQRRELFFTATKILERELSADAWNVFQLAILGEVPIEAVAKRLGKTVGATYAAKGRAMNRIRQIVERLQKEYQD